MYIWNNCRCRNGKGRRLLYIIALKFKDVRHFYTEGCGRMSRISFLWLIGTDMREIWQTVMFAFWSFLSASKSCLVFRHPCYKGLESRPHQEWASSLFSLAFFSDCPLHCHCSPVHNGFQPTSPLFFVFLVFMNHQLCLVLFLSPCRCLSSLWCGQNRTVVFLW